MALGVGYHDVADGHLATVVTDLEMTQQAPPRPAHLPEGALIAHVPGPDTVWYRELFLRVGGQPWLWFSRLQMPERELAAILQDPLIEILKLDIGGDALGFIELDFRVKGQCEIAYFGVDPSLTGTTAGRCLMNHGISRAWSQPIQKLILHTCTLDHPRALAFYRRTGFTAVRHRIEVMSDPRQSGLLPPSAAPHVPMFQGLKQGR